MRHTGEQTVVGLPPTLGAMKGQAELIGKDGSSLRSPLQITAYNPVDIKIMLVFTKVLPQFLRFPDSFIDEPPLASPSAVSFFILTMSNEIDSHLVPP